IPTVATASRARTWSDGSSDRPQGMRPPSRLSPAMGDTFRLAQIQQAALDRDPRGRQLLLQDSSSALRLRNLATERLPALVVRSQASHQSEVPAIPVQNPAFNVPVPPKDRFEVSLDAQQLIYDGGVLDSRRRVEEADLRAERARITAALYPLRT